MQRIRESKSHLHILVSILLLLHAHTCTHSDPDASSSGVAESKHVFNTPLEYWNMGGGSVAKAQLATDVQQTD